MPARKAAKNLYGLPREEFIAARKQAVKELREKGHADAAEEVSALPKPTVAAWALNQAQRKESKTVEELIAAAQRVRDAQRELLEGGGREGLDEAAQEERRLAEQVVDAARAALGSPSEATVSKVRETLGGLGLDESLDLELGEGRLAKEREAAGGFGFDPSITPSAPKKAGQASAKKEAAAAKRRREKAGEALRKAEDDLRERESELEQAEQTLAKAERAAEAAVVARDKAERAVAKASQAVEDLAG